MKVTQLCLTLCDPMDCSPPGSLEGPWDSPGKNTGVGGHSLLQGIFPIQTANPGLLHCRRILDRLSHQGSLDEVGKESACSAGDTEDMSLIPGLGRSPGGSSQEYPLQFSSLKNPMDKGVWQAIVHKVTKET